MSEKLRPHPGNLVRSGGIILRIGCGANEADCEYFVRNKGMTLVTGGETNGYCKQVEFKADQDAPVWVVDVLEDRPFQGKPVTVFCGETAKKDE